MLCNVQWYAMVMVTVMVTVMVMVMVVCVPAAEQITGGQVKAPKQHKTEGRPFKLVEQHD